MSWRGLKNSLISNPCPCLKINSQEDEEIIEYNFIKQFKKANTIIDYYFTIKYTDDTYENLIIED